MGPCAFRRATGQELMGHPLYQCGDTGESVTEQPVTLPSEPGDVVAFEPRSCDRCQGVADGAGFVQQGFVESGEGLDDELRRRWRTEPATVKELPTVTLACIDCVKPQLAAMALDVSRRGLRFARVVLFSHTQPDVLPDIEWRPVPKLDKDGYNRFCLGDLYREIGTKHVLTIQTDGFVLRPELWDDSWLAYDYIGAPWPEHKRHAARSRVGNSGCCLRSLWLLGWTSGLRGDVDRLRWDGRLLDDAATCHVLYDALIERGCKFAPPEVAARFAVEERTEFAAGINHCFGFHSQKHSPARLLIAELDAWKGRV